MSTEPRITIKRGDTKRHIFKLSDKSTLQTIDISTWTSFVMTVNTNRRPSDTSPIPLSLVGHIGSIAGSFTIDGLDGRVSFIPPGTWAAGSYHYDAQAIDANGDKVTFASGRYIIEQDITKA